MFDLDILMSDSDLAVDAIKVTKPRKKLEVTLFFLNVGPPRLYLTPVYSAGLK